MVYHKSCVLIGYSTNSLICDRPLVEKLPRFEQTKFNFLLFIFCFFVFLTDYYVYTKTIRPLSLVDYDFDSPFDRVRPHGLSNRSPLVLEVYYIFHIRKEEPGQHAWSDLAFTSQNLKFAGQLSDDRLLFAGSHRELLNSEYLHVTGEARTNAANVGILACNLNRTEKAITHTS